MTTTPRVLVVDGISETEAVLRAVLEPQGARVERCRSSECPASQSSPPRVIIVDLDDASSEETYPPPWPDVPRVVLGSARVEGTEPPGRFLEKPFDYPELIRLVESLLDLPTERRRVG